MTAEPSRTRWRTWTSVVVLLVLGAFGALASLRVAQRARFVVPYSTYGAGALGAKGLYALTAALGRAPERWSRDHGGLSDVGSPSRTMLVGLGGCADATARRITRLEAKRVFEWVEQGGVWVVAGAADYLPASLGATLDEHPSCDPGWDAVLTDLDDEDEPELAPAEAARAGRDGYVLPLARARDFAALDRLALRAPSTLSTLPADADVLLAGADGAPLAIAIPRGRGHVVVLASASPFQNRDLLAADGGALFARVLARHPGVSRVLFDEFHLGMGERRTLVGWLTDRGAGPLLLQLLLVAALVVSRVGRRFGVPLREPAPRAGGTASYARTTGVLYARTRDAAGAFAVLVRRACRRVARAQHVRTTDPRSLADALRRRGRVASANAVERFAGLAALPGSVDTDGALARAADSLDRLVMVAVRDGAVDRRSAARAGAASGARRGAHVEGDRDDAADAATPYPPPAERKHSA